MNKLIYLILFGLLSMNIKANAQGKINLMNGKIYEFDSLWKAPKNKFVYISTDNKKSCSIRIKRVFSINYPDGKEEILYVTDTVNNVFNLQQMRDYVKGEQDSWKYYHPKLATYGGLAIGGVAGFFGVFYGPVLPALYATVVTAATPPDVATKPYADKNLINNDYYAYGFENTSRKKILKNSLYGGGIGFGISILTYMLIFSRH